MRCARQQASCVFGLRQRRQPNVPPGDCDADPPGLGPRSTPSIVPTNPEMADLAGDGQPSGGVPDRDNLLPLCGEEDVQLFAIPSPASWIYPLDTLPGMDLLGSGWNFPREEHLEEQARPPNQLPFDRGATDPTPSMTAPKMDPIYTIRELADLNVHLYQHAETLPPATSVVSDRRPSVKGRLFEIDETFQMTQRLVDIIHDLYPNNNTVTPLPSTPDQGTVLLLLSCANRVFNIYETIFSHMRGCINGHLTPVHADGMTVSLPSIRIGSFSPPSPAAVTMHMLMVILMASNLFDQLQEVLGLHRSTRLERATETATADEENGHVSRECSHDRLEVELAVGTRTQFPDFTDQARSEVLRRARFVAGEIVSTRQMLLDMPGMRGSGVRAK